MSHSITFLAAHLVAGPTTEGVLRKTKDRDHEVLDLQQANKAPGPSGSPGWSLGGPGEEHGGPGVLGGLVDKQQGPHPPHGQQLGAWEGRGLINSVFCGGFEACGKRHLVPVTRKWATVIPKLPRTVAKCP